MSEVTYCCTGATDSDQERALVLDIPALVRLSDCNGVLNAITETVGVDFIIEGGREVVDSEVFGVGTNTEGVEGTPSSVVNELNVNTVVGVVDFSTSMYSCIETLGVFAVDTRMEGVGESSCVDARDKVFTADCGMEVGDSLI